MRPSERLEPVVDDAVRALKDVFDGTSALEDDALAIARLASSTLGTWAKLKQTESAQEGIYFTMAREMAENREQLAHYIEVTMPGVPLAKVLDAKRLVASTKK